jgi:hypothetical protein
MFSFLVMLVANAAELANKGFFYLAKFLGK